ncbi:schlafen family member 5 [Sturnira hondurensis]|uniref:schlafen family member 5 n=1 Tax=Sturnira hondurensis TaxID=192404 RepID=UPI0018798F27|nr:schlafen family member 5 [Sturnira hondurensis]XP_036922666.1 schlafen family member 5 [Sturnira hondurensis]
MFQGKTRKSAEKMSLKIDLETNFAEYVVSVGEVTLGNRKRQEMDPHLRKTQDEVVSHAICALLNSGGGVVKIEASKSYNYTIHGVGLNEHPIFKGYLHEMQEKDLFFIFVRSWNAKASGVRLATLCSNLYHRHKTSTNVMTSQEALEFLKGRTQAPRSVPGSSLSGLPDVRDGVQNESNIKASAAAVFNRPHLQYLEEVKFTKSTHVEFKMFSGEVSESFTDSLPSCVSAFANAEGGYIFWGVHEETLRVIGCVKERIDVSTLKDSIDSCIGKLPVHHFCRQKHEIKYKVKFLEVHYQGSLHGYVCAVKVEPFCCVVFAKQPSSWQVKENCVAQLTTEEWVAWMTEADPDLSRFSEMFLELSLSSTTPRSRAVCNHKSLECLEKQQRNYFPVSSDSILYRPQGLYKELFMEHKGLRNLINKQMRNISQGILIFSRSWAVDVGLLEEQGVICDALLLSQHENPVLITVFRECGKCWRDYCLRVARALKLKLVNVGGYTENLCIIPSAFLLNPDATSKDLGTSKLQKYPESYKLMTTQHMEALLQSLVIVLCGFRSLLSEELGSEVLNLLTDKQYELLSKNLRKTRELFVHGLPGTGKTILAIKIMEKISHVFHCQPGDILYICENKPLQEFVSHKNICRAMTRKTFMKNSSDVESIKHIIIDEAQNFRRENGDWYTKAKTILQKEKECHGILWIFLDYFQTSHLEHSGLPRLRNQYPREELTRVVRNADPIANYLQKVMQAVRENPPPNIPTGSLKMLQEVEWAWGVPGNLEVMERPTLEQMVVCITEKCQYLLKQGYSYKDMAVLCSTTSEAEVYKSELQRAMRKRKSSESSEEADLIRFRNASDVTGNHIVLDSVRRFSGLERNIVFGVDLQAAEPAVFHNLLLCLASRARKHLYILKMSN